MLILGKRKHSIPTLLAILVVFTSKSTSEESLEVKNDVADKASAVPVTAKVQEGKSVEKDNAPSNTEETAEDAKPEKSDQPETPNEKEENQYVKPEESDHPPQVINSEAKQSNQNMEDADQHPSVLQDGNKVDATKPEEAASPQKLAEETKKQNVKIDENNRKISLSDVNSITYDDSHTKQAKRETRTTEFLGLPRDASYFFDDLEPFINNNSVKENSCDQAQENARAARAIPTRENKAQKAKLGGKKEMTEEEADDEEDDDNEKVEEEEEKASEGDYDDDEDIEPDCQPTTEDPCASSTECTPSTTECSPTTTGPTTTTSPQCTTRATTCPTPRKTTTKCTTKFACPTKCPTTVESTKCPRICAKGNDKIIRYPVPEKTKSWDSEEKRMKKKFRAKSNRELN